MKILVAAGCLLLAFTTSTCAETIYKYLGADGKVIYSSTRIPGAKLLDLIEFTAPEAPAASERRPSESKSDDAAEQRIRQRLSELEAAWAEVQASEAALAAAEERLAAGVTRGDGDMQGRVGPANPAPPSAGGPLPPAPPSAGGPPQVAPPSAGGPMGGVRRGAGPSPEYRARLAQLEDNVAKARARAQESWRRYNRLR